MSTTVGTVTCVPHPGSGLVARLGGDVFLVVGGDPDTQQFLLRVCSQVAAKGGDGRALVRALAGHVTSAGDQMPPCVALAPSGDRLVVFVHGDAEVESGDLFKLSGRESVAWVDRLVPWPLASVTASLGGPSELVTGAFDLRDGSVPGSGFTLTDLSQVVSDDGGASLPVTEEMDNDEVRASVAAAPAPHAQQAPSAPTPPSDSAAAPSAPPAWPQEAAPAQPTAPRAPSWPEAHEPSAPSAPQAPPAAPSWPEAPSAPQAPSWSDAPSAQAPPQAPSAPQPRSSPPAPSAPQAPQPSSAPQAPAPAPATDWDAEPVARGGDRPRPGDVGPPAFESVIIGLHDDGADDMFDDEPAPERAPLPVAGERQLREPSDGRAEVRGVYCKNNHFNDPRQLFCAVCGINMVQQTPILSNGPRPPLGVLVLDDGTVFQLSEDYILGREPLADESVVEGRRRALVLDDEYKTVSRAHARIELHDWDVVLFDNGSANGTFVAAEGETTWTHVPPGAPVVLQPGARILVGRRTLVYNTHRA